MPETKSKEKFRHPIAEWTVTALLFLFGTTSLVQAYVIPTGSMENTLLIGDHLLVDKVSYAPANGLGSSLLPYQEIERGDIIVLRYPLDLSETYVKRVVSVPGDRTRIVDRTLYVNGEAVVEPYVVHRADYSDDYRDNFPAVPNFDPPAEVVEMLTRHVVQGELIVPQEKYFALGDNRDFSSDSRYWGFVPRENIIGKPLLIWWSFEAATEHYLDDRFSPDHFRYVASHFFSKTRWERMFRLIRSDRTLSRP